MVLTKYNFIPLKKYKTFLILVFCFCCFVLYAQVRRSVLERKRHIIMERIKETKSQLNETAVKKQKTEQNQAFIQGDIEKKDAKMDVVSEQLDNSSESLIRSYEVISSLNEDIVQLRSDYGMIVRKAFYQQLNHNEIDFLLSSDDFNQLSQRFFYIKKIDQFKTRQVELIKGTMLALKNKINRLELKIEQKEQTLDNLQEQKEVLAEKLDLEEGKLSNLSKEESRLRNDLRIQKRQAERLDGIISAVISAEIAERRRAIQEAARAISAYRTKENDNTTVTTTPSTVNKKSRRRERKQRQEQESIARTNDVEIRETPEIKALSDNFRKNKGNLPWPVAQGAIVKNFGRQEHPSLRGVFTISNGVDIQTVENSDVKAVSNGKVVAVQFIVGSDYLVIVQHGSFYTVYSNLDRTYIRKGDTVSYKQSIGKVASNKVHFEVWNNSSRENPKSWLAKL